ncbi:cobalamin-independent methionine synthase catalytic subunit [Actinophytocola oryzae]|uniref:Cobalamin-independent methionine synthase catalytic subunit n=2 Tax=Actinophytocola oryzae TaxID=502181 RepID=A0A4R7VVQ0_9PSEU|nr:cobalamin-independent methionine synthase catalytic subunit [Actinophytocola oryzae]
MPGTDPVEAAAVVVGELPDLPHLPELPKRGLGADMIGRTAALLVDLAVEVVPSAYRVAARPGGDHRTAVDHLRRDLDAFEEAVEVAKPSLVKVQLAGPWTLTSEVELPRGHRAMTDQGALRDFTESLAEGITRHVAEVRKRTGADVVVQLDEPSLPAVLAGALSTPSGLSTVPAVADPDARDVLATVIDAARAATGQPVIVHCCAPRPPVALFRSAGADAVSLDATLLEGTPAVFTDSLGEAWDDGCVLLLGLAPSTDPRRPVTFHEAARPALELVDRLGFPRSILADRAVPTPTCGLSSATSGWARRALELVREVGKGFVEPPESW